MEQKFSSKQTNSTKKETTIPTTNQEQEVYKCSFAGCESTFTKKDNMRQHLRCHFSNGYISKRDKKTTSSSSTSSTSSSTSTSTSSYLLDTFMILPFNPTSSSSSSSSVSKQPKFQKFQQNDLHRGSSSSSSTSSCSSSPISSHLQVQDHQSVKNKKRSSTSSSSSERKGQDKKYKMDQAKPFVYHQDKKLNENKRGEEKSSLSSPDSFHYDMSFDSSSLSPTSPTKYNYMNDYQKPSFSSLVFAASTKSYEAVQVHSNSYSSSSLSSEEEIEQNQPKHQQLLSFQSLMTPFTFQGHPQVHHDNQDNDDEDEDETQQQQQIEAPLRTKEVLSLQFLIH